MNGLDFHNCSLSLKFEDAVLVLSTSKGLKIGLPDETELNDEVKIKLSCNHVLDGNIFRVPLVLCSEFSSQTDTIIDHKVRLLGELIQMLN